MKKQNGVKRASVQTKKPAKSPVFSASSPSEYCCIEKKTTIFQDASFQRKSMAVPGIV